MQLSSDVRIPDGLLAANALLAENSHQGFATSTHTLHQGFYFAISSTAIGISGTLYDGRIGSRYTGKERDQESGLDYFGARYYGSSMGRFMSPDPSQLHFADPTNPQSLNLYAYVVNNPLGYIDPDGLHFECFTVTITPTDDTDTSHQSQTRTCKWVDDPHQDLLSGGVMTGGVNINILPPMAQPKPAPNAPSNGLLTPKQQRCAGAALKKNAVALSFDAAGIGAGFLPGGDLVVAGAQGAVSVASGINSAAHGDASGATLGILGLPASFAGASAKFFGVGAKAIPGVGTAISALGALNDTYSTYQDYQACLEGH